jgi:FAD:protein FMN transferase
MVSIEKLNGIGTQWHIDVFDADTADTDTLTERIGALISTYEAAYSRFKPDSLVSILNSTGHLENPPTELVALLKTGKQLYTKTQGNFNFLTGGIQVARGYDANYSFTEQAEQPTKLPNVHTDLQITNDHITLLQGQVDLGGYGKGVLIDNITSALKTWGYRYFVINGGGDIFVTSKDEAPITIMVAHPFIPKHYTHRLELKDCALGVSSPAGRQWHAKNSQVKYSHIIATQAIAQTPEYGAAVVAPTATEADAYATVLTTLGTSPNLINAICPAPDYAWLIVSETNRAIQSQNWSGVPLGDVEKT